MTVCCWTPRYSRVVKSEPQLAHVCRKCCLFSVEKYTAPRKRNNRETRVRLPPSTRQEATRVLGVLTIARIQTANSKRQTGESFAREANFFLRGSHKFKAQWPLQDSIRWRDEHWSCRCSLCPSANMPVIRRFHASEPLLYLFALSCHRQPLCHRGS